LAPPTLELDSDRALWLRAYREHGPSILAFLTSRTGRRDLAEEFLQETFVRAMRRGARLVPGPELRSYLFTTAHHLVISDRRRARPRLFSELTEQEQAVLEAPREDALRSSEAEWDLGKVRERLEGALAALRPDHREAFRAAVLRQKPYAEIARENGWTREQVKVNVHRARKKVIALLRDLLRPEEEKRP
jgi:RNA polymerase sigma-70 factor, ECF subfamily